MKHFKNFDRYLEVGFYADEFRTYLCSNPNPNFKYTFFLHDFLSMNILQPAPRPTFNQLLNNIKIQSEQDCYEHILNKRWKYW